MKQIFACFWLILLLAVLPLKRATAEIYTWQDSSGTVHFTDDLGQVPEAQRRQFQDAPEPTPPRQAPPTNPAPEPKPPAAPPPAAAAASPTPAQGTVKDQAYWQGRIQDAQQGLIAAQKELDLVYNDQRKNLESGPGMQERKATLAARETELKARIAKLQKDVDTNIPDEAQKAGAPPGWLR